MANWIEIKHQARQWHKILLTETKGDDSATALLNAATALTGIKRIPLLPEDPYLWVQTLAMIKMPT